MLAFGGDIHFEEYLAPLARDPEALAPLADLWADADFRMANLETAITEGGTKVLLRVPLNKRYVWRDLLSVMERLEGL